MIFLPQNYRKWFILLVALWLVAPPLARSGRAQQNPQISTFFIDLWPDFDRNELLVLMTAELSSDALLPTTVTIPLPANATLHTVARLDETNSLNDDVEYRLEGEHLEIMLPTRGFRVEYYEPVELTGEERQISFEWEAPFDIPLMTLTVQEPTAAENFTLSQDILEIRGHGNLSYHMLPTRQLRTGDEVNLTIEYRLPELQLTRPPLETEAAEPTAVPPPTLFERIQNNWQLYILGSFTFLIFVVAVVQIVREQGGRRLRKPKRQGATEGFCSACGNALQPKDKFCRHCGLELT